MFKVKLLHGAVKGTYTIDFHHRRQRLGIGDWIDIHKGVARKIEKGEIESLQEREVCQCIIYRKFDDEEGKPRAIVEALAVCHPLDEKKYDRKQGRKQAFAQAVFEMFGGPIRGTSRRRDFNKILFDSDDIKSNGSLKEIRSIFWLNFFGSIVAPGFKKVRDFTTGLTMKKEKGEKS